MVDGNGQEGVAASAAVISESTSVGLDYIANNLNIQHHETCPPSVGAADVLDDVEENIIEPDVILPATLMSDDSSAGGAPSAGVQADMPGDGDMLQRLTPAMSMGASVGGGGGGVFTNGGTAITATLATSTRRSAAHSLRTRRALRRNNAIHKDLCGGGGGAAGNNNGSSGGQHNGLKAATAYDEFMAFGVTVAAKLSKMSTYQRLYAENIINQTLFKGMLNQLQPPLDAQLRSSPSSSPMLNMAIGSPPPPPLLPSPMPTPTAATTTTTTTVIKRESP